MTASVRASWGQGAVVSLSVLGICPALCSAQVDFELRTRLALGWGEDAAPISSPLVITEPGTYNFELQEGVYNAEGFTNFGVANWIGRIHSTEPALSQPENPRVAPFDNSIGRDGVVSDDQTMIGSGEQGYIDATVGPRGFWYQSPPAPPPPPPHGADEFVALYRFSLTITDMSEREITLTAESISNAYTPITGWLVFRDIPPDPEQGMPGYIEYFPMTLPPEYWQQVPTATATLRVVPAPSALWAFAVLSPCLRRRRAFSG